MMTQQPSSLPWLLEPDPEAPGVRYFALRDLLGRDEEDPEVRAAQAAVMASGPVPAILDAQHPEGYWVKPGGGYSPKYRATVWQVLFLAELGADPADERVRRGCHYLLGHSLASSGAFAAGTNPSPSGAIHCLNGNLLYALIRLGWLEDGRVQGAIDWLARSITGEGDIQYHEWGTTAPNFACGINNSLPCAWGANKALRALLAIPPAARTPAVQAALDRGAALLLSRDPAVADYYPTGGKISSAWFKLGFPLAYWSDVLETLQVLVDLGYGADPRLGGAIAWLLDKRDEAGRWRNEHKLLGKTWLDIDRGRSPSKWVTLRALRVLQAPV